MTHIFAPYLIPVDFYFAWSLWFALTQRDRSAVPAPTCGIPLGCLVMIIGFIPIAFSNWEEGWNMASLLILLPFFGCLCTACFVIEHERVVMLLGLVQMALGLSIIVLLSFSGLGLFFWYGCAPLYPSIYGMGCWGFPLLVDIALFIFLIFIIVLINLPSIYLGTCVFMIGWEESKAASQGSPVACPEPAADADWIGPVVGRQAEYPTIEKGEVMA
jgi:hypothetical protein